MSSTPGSKSDDFASRLVSTLYPQPPSILQAVPPQPRRPRGFFAELLAGRPEALYADSLEHSERYDAPTTRLLEELATQPRREVSEEERSLLDRATFAFATVRKEAEVPPVKKETPRARSQDDDDDDDDPPLDALPQFWW